MPALLQSRIQVLSIVWATWDASNAASLKKICQARCNRLPKEKMADCLGKCQKVLTARNHLSAKVKKN